MVADEVGPAGCPEAGTWRRTDRVACLRQVSDGAAYGSRASRAGSGGCHGAAPVPGVEPPRVSSCAGSETGPVTGMRWALGHFTLPGVERESSHGP